LFIGMLIPAMRAMVCPDPKTLGKVLYFNSKTTVRSSSYVNLWGGPEPIQKHLRHWFYKSFSPLTLLVASVWTNHVHHPTAAYDFAVLTNLLHGRSDFHLSLPKL